MRGSWNEPQNQDSKERAMLRDVISLHSNSFHPGPGSVKKTLHTVDYMCTT